MGKIFTGDGWIIKVQGAEHPPVHVHLLHPNGKAVLFLDGTLINNGVPAKVVAEAALLGNGKCCPDCAGMAEHG
jgi:hypothetical protein